MNRKIWGRRSANGYTLVEVLVATSLAAIILTAVLTTTLMLGRSSTSLGNYTEMESEARLGLEQFARDVRQARAITWNSTTSVTLSFPADSPAAVTYELDGADETEFHRTQTGTTRVLLKGITKFRLTGYRLGGYPIEEDVSLDDASALTKQLEISLTAKRSRATVATATNTVLSARFILRNKAVAM